MVFFKIQILCNPRLSVIRSTFKIGIYFNLIHMFNFSCSMRTNEANMAHSFMKTHLASCSLNIMIYSKLPETDCSEIQTFTGLQRASSDAPLQEKTTGSDTLFHSTLPQCVCVCVRARARERESERVCVSERV